MWFRRNGALRSILLDRPRSIVDQAHGRWSIRVRPLDGPGAGILDNRIWLLLRPRCAAKQSIGRRLYSCLYLALHELLFSLSRSRLTPIGEPSSLLDLRRVSRCVRLPTCLSRLVRTGGLPLRVPASCSSPQHHPSVSLSQCSPLRTAGLRVLWGVSRCYCPRHDAL